MELHERIRELRKNQLKLTQSAFGERLGVSRDVIKNIELNLLARPDQKLSLIRLMCKEFGVSEEWILNESGPIFVQPDAFSLDQYAKDHGMTAQDLKILKLYFSFDPKTRQDAIAYFMNYMAEEPVSIEKLQHTLQEPNLPVRKSIFDGVPDNPEDLERIAPPVDINKVPRHKRQGFSIKAIKDNESAG